MKYRQKTHFSVPNWLCQKGSYILLYFTNF